MPGFKDIVGHEMIKKHFQKAIEANHVSHAYILAGEAGMGRKSLANAFAMTLLCEEGKKEPCMQCHACKQVTGGGHPDLSYVKHEKPNSIGVDDIRKQINDTIMIRPYSSCYKIYIVDEAEMMTAQAQNALLKTIEEPPSYAIIMLLTTNQEAFLPTILSRCVQLKLKPLTDSVIKRYLTESLGIPDAKAEIYTAFARGNLGKAIRLASSEDFQLMYTGLVRMLKCLKDVDITGLLDFIKKLKDEHRDIYRCLDFMQLWYRDVLVYKVTKEIDFLVFKEEYNTIKEISGACGYGGIEKIFRAIDKAWRRMNANVNTELAMELMLLVMKEN